MRVKLNLIPHVATQLEVLESRRQKPSELAPLPCNVT